MKLLVAPIALVGLGAFILLHALYVFCNLRFKIVINLFNIILHALYILVLALYGFSTEEGALIYMISLFSYVSMSALRYAVGARRARIRAERDKDEEEASV